MEKKINSSPQGDFWREHLRESDFGDKPRWQSQCHRETGERDFCCEAILPGIAGVKLEKGLESFGNIKTKRRAQAGADN